MFKKAYQLFMKFLTNFNILFYQIKEKFIGCKCKVCISKIYYCGICKKILTHNRIHRDDPNGYFWCNENNFGICKVDVDIKSPWHNNPYISMRYRYDDIIVELLWEHTHLSIRKYTVLGNGKDGILRSKHNLPAETLSLKQIIKFIAMAKEERTKFLGKILLLS